jgi:hypothetical protein
VFVREHLEPGFIDRVAILFFFEEDGHVSNVIGRAAGLMHEKLQIPKHRLGLLIRIR